MQIAFERDTPQSPDYHTDVNFRKNNQRAPRQKVRFPRRNPQKYPSNTQHKNIEPDTTRKP